MWKQCFPWCWWCSTMSNMFFFGVFWGWFCWVLTWFILVPGGKWFLFPPFSGLIVPSIFFSILKYPLCRHVLLFLSISIYIYTYLYCFWFSSFVGCSYDLIVLFGAQHILFQELHRMLRLLSQHLRVFLSGCSDAHQPVMHWLFSLEELSAIRITCFVSNHVFVSHRRSWQSADFVFDIFIIPWIWWISATNSFKQWNSLCQPMPSDATNWRGFNGSQEVRERLHRPGGWTARERHQKRSEQNIQRPGGGDKCRDVSAVPDQWKIQSEDSISPGDEGIHVVFLFGTLFEVRRCLCLA